MGIIVCLRRLGTEQLVFLLGRDSKYCWKNILALFLVKSKYLMLTENAFCGNSSTDSTRAVSFCSSLLPGDHCFEYIMGERENFTLQVYTEFLLFNSCSCCDSFCLTRVGGGKCHLLRGETGSSQNFELVLRSCEHIWPFLSSSTFQ